MTTEHLSEKAELPTEFTASAVSASASTAAATTGDGQQQQSVPAPTSDPATEQSSPLAELPSAKVGVMEVEGVQIEMFSLARLREQNLALEQAQAAANAAKKEQRKNQRKRKDSSADSPTQPKPKRKRTAKAAASAVPSFPDEDAAAELSPADVMTPPAPVTEPALDLDKAIVETALPKESSALVVADPAPAPTTAPADPEPTEQASADTPPSVAQSLLQSLISNVEQQELQASHVTDEEVAQAAAVETEALQHAQESAAAADEGAALGSGTSAGFPEPEWADMDELTPEQLERFSHMGLSEGDICPLCSNGLLIMRHSYKADFLGCSNFPHCKFHLFTGKRSAVVTLKELISTCPECHGLLEVKKGRFGIFIGCSNYPACTYVYRRQDETPLVQVACPVCHQGHLVERRGRSGKTFYGCDNFPKCSFSVFGPPVQQVCEECGFPVMYKKKTKKGFVLVCGDPKCASHRKKAKPQLESES